jgi:hypothetical protein
MRKRMIDRVSPMDEDWLDLQLLAEVELTSHAGVRAPHASLAQLRIA